MLFNSRTKLSCLLIAFLLSSCGVRHDTGKNVIGTEIPQLWEDSYSMMQVGEADQLQFYSYDAYGQRFNFVEAASGLLNFSQALGPNEGGRAWVSGGKDGFTFDIKEKTVRVMAQTGASTELFSFAGQVKSSAVDFENGYFVFVDEYFSIGLARINAQADVEKQWIGGSSIAGASSVLAGELLSEGRLILLADNGSLAVVDLDATLSSESWVLETLPLGFVKPSWVGRVDAFPNRILVLDQDSLDLVDLDSKTILSSQALSGYDARVSKQGRDHVWIYEPAGARTRFYAGDTQGNLAEISLKLGSSPSLVSYMGESSVVLYNRDYELIKARMSDALVEQSIELQPQVRVGLSEDTAVLMYKSPLGAMEVLNLSDRSKLVYKGFNLEALQSR